MRDWLWVEDHARAIDTIFHNGVNAETYNIGGHNEWTNIALVHQLCEVMDEKLGRAMIEDVGRHSFDPAHLVRDLLVMRHELADVHSTFSVATVFPVRT